MQRFLPFIVIALCASFSANAQQPYEWNVLPNSPVQSGRYEDISFLNASQGWAVAGNATVIRTANGGETWEVIKASAPYNLYFRCISLVSSTKAFIGTLSTSNPLIVTSNSGKSFSGVTIAGKKPSKICGLYRTGQTIYGVGGYDGNATLVKSTDDGATWTGSDMTPYAMSLVDVHFFNDSTGLTVGSVGGSTFSTGHSVVLRTTNGGSSWEKVFESTRTKEWGWKIYFLNDSVGYVSIERNSTDGAGVFYLKTTDGGRTWKERFFLQDYDVEGIGFADEATGWIGGWTGATYQTVDSGKTWDMFPRSNVMVNLNRIRRVNDTLMFGAGTRILRYAPAAVLSADREDAASAPRAFTAQNFPNPFNPSTTIRFTLPQPGTVRIFIYNAVGTMIEGIMDNPKPAGTYSLQWRPSSSLSSGVYFYQIQTEHGSVTGSMTYLK
ncbi:MAG: T9SS type A sorting domain-containing protein [Bacteroidetes bacterium]|nr:T9SS type A sorting domain-containing protein [Bacteroidota bacterium]